MSKKAVFLDRDGTIARDVNYCSRVEDFELLPTVPQAIRLLNEKGFKVVVITNQSGIARGYFNEDMLAQIHQKMRRELAKHGAEVDAIYYCPHHPDEKCDCRKPQTALFQQAAQDLGIDLGHSYVVGDTDMDIKAGKAIGARTVRVTTGPNSDRYDGQQPDYAAASLLEAAGWIVEDSSITTTIAAGVLAQREERGDGMRE